MIGFRPGMPATWTVGVVTVVGALAWATQPAVAAESATDQLQLTTDRVVVFKDGYYLALKSGTAVTSKEGEIHLLDVPDNAVLGSVWATSTRGKLNAMVASRETVRTVEEIAAPCTQMIEVLQANVGQQARIVMQDKTAWHGEILRVMSEPTLAPPTPAFSHLLDTKDDTAVGALLRRRLAGPAAPTIAVSGITGSQFILRTDDGDVLLHLGQIQSLTIKQMKSTVTRTVTTTTSPKRLTLRFAEPGKPVDVSFMYFQSGLRWIPTYRIGLLN